MNTSTLPSIVHAFSFSGSGFLPQFCCSSSSSSSCAICVRIRMQYIAYHKYLKWFTYTSVADSIRVPQPRCNVTISTTLFPTINTHTSADPLSEALNIYFIMIIITIPKCSSASSNEKSKNDEKRMRWLEINPLNARPSWISHINNALKKSPKCTEFWALNVECNLRCSSVKWAGVKR